MAKARRRTSRGRKRKRKASKGKGRRCVMRGTGSFRQSARKGLGYLKRGVRVAAPAIALGGLALAGRYAAQKAFESAMNPDNQAKAGRYIANRMLDHAFKSSTRTSI